jgi:hypothetical protein
MVDSDTFHPLAERCLRYIMDADFENDDMLYIKCGGDGDNGNYLLTYLDQFFTLLDKEKEKCE